MLEVDFSFCLPYESALFYANLTGQHSIRINDQWRICFEWREGDAYNVEIADYH